MAGWGAGCVLGPAWAAPEAVRFPLAMIVVKIRDCVVKQNQILIRTLLQRQIWPGFR